MRAFFFVFILILFPLCGDQYACSQSREAILKYWGERGVSFDMEGGKDPYVLNNSLLPLERISTSLGDFEVGTLSEFFDDIKQLGDVACVDLYFTIQQEGDFTLVKLFTESISKFRSFHVIVRDGNKLSSRITSALAGIINLNQFVSRGDDRSAVPKECIISLSEHKNLRYLCLAGSDITDGDLEPLAKLLKLRVLEISSRGELTGEFIRHISGPHLEKLLIGGPKISDEIFKLVTRFQGLEELIIFESMAEGHMLGELTALKKLRFLSLQQSPIGGGGLLGLQKVKSLEDIVFVSSPISDKDVKYLKQISNIKRMRFYKCDITESGVDELKLALDKIAFEYVPKD